MIVALVTLGDRSTISCSIQAPLLSSQLAPRMDRASMPEGVWQRLGVPGQQAGFCIGGSNARPFHSIEAGWHHNTLERQRNRRQPCHPVTIATFWPSRWKASGRGVEPPMRKNRHPAAMPREVCGRHRSAWIHPWHPPRRLHRIEIHERRFSPCPSWNGGQSGRASCCRHGRAGDSRAEQARASGNPRSPLRLASCLPVPHAAAPTDRRR